MFYSKLPYFEVVKSGKHCDCSPIVINTYWTNFQLKLKEKSFFGHEFIAGCSVHYFFGDRNFYEL